VLVNPGAVFIDGDLRSAFDITRRADRLANEQTPPMQARMLAGCDNIPFDAR
jgi:hypothetical protein